jgi:hypothetical protein
MAITIKTHNINMRLIFSWGVKSRVREFEKNGKAFANISVDENKRITTRLYAIFPDQLDLVWECASIKEAFAHIRKHC